MLLIYMFCLSTAYSADLSDKQLLEWIRGWVNKMPRPLQEEDAIKNWWPLENEDQWTYRVTDSRWEIGKKYIDKEFSIKIVRGNKTGDRYLFDVKGFDEFPYSGLKVVDNRIFLILKEQPENYLPFLVFPLFKGIMYADKDYEYESIKLCVILSTEKGFYAPVRNEFRTVSKVEGNLFYIENMDSGPGVIRELVVFEKGSGIVEWVLDGGIKIKRVPKEPEVLSISVFTGPWIITFEPSGHASAQYGSVPGDCGYVPPGTVDFDSLLKSIKSAQKKEIKEASDKFQVAIHFKGQTSATAFVFTDMSFLRLVLESLEIKWHQVSGGERFAELLEKYPIIQK
jgi:hypothetical protein